jgi:hypothetical protein
MAHQFGSALRNNMATQLVNSLANGVLRLFSGAVPANCAAADPSGLLASGTLPAVAASASGGVVTKSGTWNFTGSAGGTVASFRLYEAGGTVCVHQGTVTLTGSGGDMTLDNTNIANSQAGSVGTYSVTMGGA